MLSFVDLSGRVVYPELEVVTARLTCFNSDLPSRLPFGNEKGDFELDRGGPVRAIVALVKPTRVVQPPLGSSQAWRLVSQLSLNYLSLADGEDSASNGETEGGKGTEAYARCYGCTISARARGPAADRRRGRGAQRAGIRAHRDGARPELRARPARRARSRRGAVHRRRRYLFASVLEHFFGLYASINSFSTLTARSRQRKGGIRAWPPRAGWKPLL